MNLLQLMKSVTTKYILTLIKAPTKSTYVFGNRVPTKYDVKREYVANMKALGEVARQTGDDKAVNYASGVVDSEIADLEAALKEAKGK